MVTTLLSTLIFLRFFREIKSIQLLSSSLQVESELICDFASGTNLILLNIRGWDCNESTPLIHACNNSISSWEGIYCNSDSIVGIDLNGFSLSGTIPASIGYLSSLKYLYLDNNYFVGAIPSTIGLLNNLIQFTVSNNHITGSIPSSLVLLSNLQNLNFATNSLSGKLLSSINNLSNLRILKLQSNYLTGTIPSTVGFLTALNFFELHKNLLTGTISTTIGFLTLLVRLQFLRNYLTGTIPTSIGYLNKLTRLTLYGNLLTGTIPTTIGLLSEMINFYPFENQLTGTIPSSLGLLTNMNVIALYTNKLTGTVPSSLGNLTKLYYINFSLNKLSGTLPTSLGLLIKLEEFYINVNKFTGTIPTTLGNLSILGLIDFSSNSLMGHLPDWCWEKNMLSGIFIDYNLLSGPISSKIGLATKISHINIRTNLLSGTIPTTIGYLSLLIVLTIPENRLTGTIPLEIANLTALYSLQLFSNKLTGTLPSVVFAMPTIGNFYLQSNYFTGTIPTVITRNAALLNSLNLNENSLTGTIPEHIGNCSTLFELDLSNNLLSGSLPTSLVIITRLQYVYLSGNKITGSLPSWIGSWTNLRVLEVNNNAFTGTVPTVLSTFSLLYEVYLRGNRFEGPISRIFNITRQKLIRNIDISDNYLTGSIPSTWFDSSVLLIFAATSNCLMLPDLEHICKASNLEVFSLDGLETAEKCRNFFFKSSNSDTYTLVHNVKKNIPACLYALPKLSLLHLSGNALTGSIPADVVPGDSLTDLALSYNRLHGTIPEVIQARNWTALDLSFNSFSGTLSTSIPTTTSSSKLSVIINRLSGNIPQSLLQRSDISVVEGNIFQCNFDGSKLPSGDSNSSSYNCGSDAFFIALYFFFGSLLINAVVVVILAYFKGIPVSLKFKTPSKRIALIKLMIKLISLIVTMTAFILCVMMPVFGALSIYYGTHSYEYAWSVSAGFLSGHNAKVILLVVWSGMMYFFIVMHRLIFKSSSLSITNVVPEALGTTEVDANPRGLIWDNIVLSMLFLIDVVVVFAANAAYIIATLRGDVYTVVFLQFLLGIFKVIWRYGYIEYISVFRDWITGHTHRNKHELLFLTLMLVLNNVVLPVFSEAVIDSNCIYNMFVSAKPVVSSYDYEVCQSEVNPATDLCYDNSLLTVDIFFTPPFIYRYQCCATIIRNYVSVYTYMFVFTALQIPMSAVVVWVRKRFIKDSLLYRLLGIWVHQLHSDTPYLNYPLYVAGLISNLAILVTFGGAFPPLALIILISMLLDATYVSNILPPEVLPIPINDLGMTIYLVPFSALFFSFFLFDVSDYQKDSWSSLWAPMTIIIIPLLYFSMHPLVAVISSKHESRDDFYHVNHQPEESEVVNHDPIDTFQVVVSNEDVVILNEDVPVKANIDNEVERIEAGRSSEIEMKGRADWIEMSTEFEIRNSDNNNNDDDENDVSTISLMI